MSNTMGQTFLRNLLISKLRPVFRLVNSCSSVYVGECYKFLNVPLWKYSVRSSVTWTCASRGGFCFAFMRHKPSLQLYSTLTSNCSVVIASPPQILMRTSIKQYSANVEKKPESSKECEHSKRHDDDSVTPERLSLFKRFKQMYRDYWYVLIPVHVVTSVGWFGAFYYMCVSGVDVVAALESLNISEKIINPLRDSKAGYVALSYALYKIATPLRYTVTLGGTTVSINYLKKWGYIKPIPPREKLKELYDEKKENLIERKDAIIKGTAEQLKERKESFMRSYRSKK